jgi:hypothetical protein
LSGARIKDLDFTRFGFFCDFRALPIKNDNYPNTSPILVIAQFLSERFSSERGPPLMQLAQFRPGENDAVPVNNQVIQSHRSEVKFAAARSPAPPTLIWERLRFAFSLLRGALRAERSLRAFSTPPACDQDKRAAASASF